MNACFAENSQLFLPLLDLVQNTHTSIEESLQEAGRGLVEQLLMLSAMEIAGYKHPGKQRCDVRWHGSQRGQMVMDYRKLNVQRPRLRTKARGEVAIPAYEQLSQNPRLGQRVCDIMMTVVSTRKYERAARDGRHRGHPKSSFRASSSRQRKGAFGGDGTALRRPEHSGDLHGRHHRRQPHLGSHRGG